MLHKGGFEQLTPILTSDSAKQPTSADGGAPL